jgi:hypothetical protein
VLAPGRGVAVRVITDDDKSYDPGSDADRLRAAGIPCKMAVGNYHPENERCCSTYP